MSEIRKFDTGATRNSEDGKLDFEGFLHPLVIQRFSLYMNKHRYLEDGTIRASDDWSKGIPKESAIKSGLRHFMDLWLEHRGYESREGIEDALCGVLFNVQSYLLTVLQEKENYNLAVENTQALMNVLDPPQPLTTTTKQYEEAGFPNGAGQSLPEPEKQEKPNPVTAMLRKLGAKL